MRSGRMRYKSLRILLRKYFILALLIKKVFFEVISSHVHFYQIMSESGTTFADDGTARQEPPSETTPSIDPQASLNKALSQISTNPGNMAALLQ